MAKTLEQSFERLEEIIAQMDALTLYRKIGKCLTSRFYYFSCFITIALQAASKEKQCPAE